MGSKIIKEELQAVHDKDLEKLLESLGILEKLKKGELRCKFCKEIVTLDNLHSIFPEAGAIKVICENVICVKGLQELLREGKVTI